MSRYLDRPPTDLRRRDRRLAEDEWMDRFLARAGFGHLSVTAPDGQPLIHTNLFWWDGAMVWMHTAPVGKLRAVVEAGSARACFSVAEHGRMLPADTPFDFSTEYASIICYGAVDVVQDLALKRRALEGLMRKYAPQLEPGRDYRPMPDDDVERTTVLRVTVSERVGKHNVKPMDWPAYEYPGESFIAAEREAGRVTVKSNEVA